MTVDISNQINDEKKERKQNISGRTGGRIFLLSLQTLKGKNIVDTFNYI